MTSEEKAGQPEELARNWATIWASELGALAGDREAYDFWRTALHWWSVFGATAGAALADAFISRPDAPARPATAHAPPAESDELVEQLRRRVAELERRLADRDRRL